ncbi:PREDICTED: mastermind-like protein 2 [Nicrophorus vespilloides]|uniref:Mastermind-like protein 2 n=1 Tax=Nicrophorus vespilloides TaxID=110193 RepID=A0ABM1M2X3_NICVS|nr:PREDICTED: mastermind-like protein 2 [Nicrophorus vespilloides]
MSAALPPLPDLIPISALRKGGKAPEVDSFNNNCSSSNSSCNSSISTGSTTCSSNSSSSRRDVQDCSPCNSTQCSGGEVMGEQRSRRTGKQPAVDLIDTSRSRGNDVAAPQQRASSSTAAAAATRKARSERHRKSDRRRERDRRKRSTSSLKSCSSLPSSPERPANPRVNPIFVWVRQQDSQIVEVKCEDYDKRNRILLTKTPQGWRAIPRTETLAPTLQRTDDTNTSNSSSTVDHRAKRKTKKRSNCKVKRRSTGVQVDDHELESEGASSPWNAHDLDPDPDPEPELDSEIEIIEVFGAVKSPVAEEEPCANSNSSSSSVSNNSRSSVSVSVSESSAQVTNTQSTTDCNNKGDVVSPLDNLLAVAELEFNQQIQSEQQWEVKPPPYKVELVEEEEEEEEEEGEEVDEEEQIDNMQQLDIFIESCAPTQTPEIEMKAKPDDCECDYTEEDDNNLAMDDILSRLEQSLRSPDTLHSEINEIIKNQKPDPSPPAPPPPPPPLHRHSNNNNNNNNSSSSSSNGNKPTEQETPTDLSTTTKDKYEELNDLMPTDLTLPKSPHKRPQSQNSETIQSPQPSGIPAVPHSPDLLYSANKSKSNIYLESLLSPPLKESPPPPKEPLDLGKTRESDSPKVTCSQEVQNPEPPTKKIKLEDITLKTLLDNESNKSENHKKSENKNAQETPRLLELLTEESEVMMAVDPVTQLKQLLKNTSLNIPDPMLIPKDKLSQILSSPAQEIPKLLTERPELRLPEALAFPHLLQDPDILVITLSQLQTIIQKQSQSLPLADKTTEEIKKKPESPKPQLPPQKPQILQQQQPPLVTQPAPKEDPKTTTTATTTNSASKAKSSRISELSSDIDAATNAAFTQMMWLPYLNQLESAAMTFGNNPEFLKLLSTMLPSFPGPMPDMTRMMGPNRLPAFQPPTFPMQPPMNYNPLELSMWQEAMLQANLAHTKNQFDLFSKKDYKAKNNNLMFGNKNPFMNVPPSNSSQFGGSTRSNLQMPPYNTHPTAKHGKSSSKHGSSNGANKSMDYVKSIFHQQHQQQQQQQQQQQHQQMQQQQQQKLYESEKQLRQMDSRQKEMLKQQETAYKQHQELQKQQELFNKQHEFYKHQQELYAQKPKVVCKSFANMSANQDVAASASVSGSKRYHSSSSNSSRLPGPIDLSGSTAVPVSGGGKLKVKQHLIDPIGSSRLLKHDDVPEVGSTTASIEEMQDAQKHLWHPLFGNQKSYTSPWNWTTVTATGE